jgi:hypothetical protein
MKKLLIALLTITVIDASAQEFIMKPKGTISELTVEVRNLFTDLVIEGGTAGEIRVVADDYEPAPEKAAGLRPLSALGPDNTGIGLHINQDGNTVTISGTRRNNSSSDYRISLPADIRLKIDYGSFNSDDIIISGMNNEVEVKSQVGDLEFADVTGPIVASTLSADINIRFTSLNQSAPSLITSISGDIDITLPQGSKGNLHLGSVSGEIYTDLEFDSVETTGRQSNINYNAGTLADTRLNGGGVEFTVKSVSGDIFLRKSQ